MNSDTTIGCQCGKVGGRVRGVSAKTVNRALCYCADCQAYLHHLHREELLDESGGTDIVQVAPNSVTLERGQEHIVGIRLSPKGLYRWYASCCNTPVGNTMTPSLPFVGIVSALFEDARSADEKNELFGKVRGKAFAKYAKGVALEGSTKLDLLLLAHTLRLIFGWKLRSKAWPHPFFERVSKMPIFPVEVLAADERKALGLDSAK